MRPTAAGQRFYEEASSILRRYEALPGLVRSSDGDVAGLVSLGMPASLSTTLVGPFIEKCRAAYPKVILKFIDGDSEFLREEVEKGRLDLALAYEDEFFPVVLRRPLFRQSHYLISSTRTEPAPGPTIALKEVAKIPLILPGHLNARRIVIDRTFAEAGLSLNLAAEAVTVSSELSAVRSGAASTILNLGDMSGFSMGDFAEPVLIEPTFYLTCCIIWSSDHSLSLAADGREGIADRISEGPYSPNQETWRCVAGLDRDGAQARVEGSASRALSRWQCLLAIANRHARRRTRYRLASEQSPGRSIPSP